MARRRKAGFAEDLMELASLLPWWAGIALGLLSYLLLHRLAVQPLMPSTGALATQAIWMGLTTAGQYAVPLIFFAGAGLSAWRRSERTKLIVDVAQSQSTSALDGMSWREFEVLVGEGFRMQGYQVVETGGGGPDGGIDLVLSRPGKNGNEKFLVQCKRWRAYKVSVDVVRELYGVMAARGATGGIVVTSGRFTEEAIQFADGRNVRLVDGPKLHGLIRQAKAGAQTAVPARPERTDRQAAAAQSATPNCLACAKPMSKRVAKRGGNAGQAFWGCADYPTCRGTRTLQ